MSRADDIFILAILVRPRVPDVRCQITDVVGLFLVYPQYLVYRRAVVNASQGHKRKFLADVIPVHARLIACSADTPERIWTDILPHIDADMKNGMVAPINRDIMLASQGHKRKFLADVIPVHHAEFLDCVRGSFVVLYNHTDLNEMALAPCAYSFTLNVSGGKLNAILNQRSQDMLTADRYNLIKLMVLIIFRGKAVTGKFVEICYIIHPHFRRRKRLLFYKPLYRIDMAVVSFILQETQKYGMATYKRVYGDWESGGNSWHYPAINNSLLPVQQCSYIAGKNATDFSITIDAMDILYSGTVDGFVLVTSDSDFTRLAIRLREAGMLVVGIGEVKTPRAFTSSCHYFSYLDQVCANEGWRYVIAVDKQRQSFFL